MVNTGFYRVLPGLTGFWLGLTGLNWVLPAFYRFNRVLLSLIGLSRVFGGVYRVVPSFHQCPLMANAQHPAGDRKLWAGAGFSCLFSLLYSTDILRTHTHTHTHTHTQTHTHRHTHKHKDGATEKEKMFDWSAPSFWLDSDSNRRAAAPFAHN